MPNPHEYNQKSKAVLELYKHADQRRGLMISRIYETMKLTTTIFLGLFTATVTILGFLKFWMAVILPFLAILIVAWSWRNIRRQYRRFLEVITWISKVEKYLELYMEIEDGKKCYFVDEKHLVPERFLKSSKFKTGSDFIETESRWCNDTMYGHFAKLYIIYIVLAIILILLALYYSFAS